MDTERFTSRLYLRTGGRWECLDADIVPAGLSAADSLANWLARDAEPGTYRCEITGYGGLLFGSAEVEVTVP